MPFFFKVRSSALKQIIAKDDKQLEIACSNSGIKSNLKWIIKGSF